MRAEDQLTPRTLPVYLLSFKVFFGDVVLDVCLFIYF